MIDSEEEEMRIPLIHQVNKNTCLEFHIYIPNLCIRKKKKYQLGPEVTKTEITFPTVIRFVETKKQLYFTARLLGFGFILSLREIQ